MDAVRIILSINSGFDDKRPLHSQAYKVGWEPMDLTAAELAAHVDCGHAFGPQFENGERNKDHFIRAGYLAIDVDGTIPLIEAREHDFVRKFGSLLYTTCSHQIAGQDHFRIVFACPRPIVSGEEWRTLAQALAEKFGADASVCDPARMFYGSRGSKPEVLGGCLTEEALEGLLALGRRLGPELRERRRARGNRRSDQVIAADEPIRLGDGTTALLSEIPPKASIHCPRHHDVRPSAFTLRSKRGDPGVSCSACGETFWLAGAEHAAYDFRKFEKIVAQLQENPAWASLAGDEFGRAPEDREIHILNKRHLDWIGFREGLLFCKSPKGSGKTTQLAGIVAEAKRAKKSILLIGHRRTLLRELAVRLGLDCYLDDGTSKQKKASKYYAVCVDSLPNRLKRDYDLVIIDECEQVLAHTCASTVRNRERVLSMLQRCVSSAPSVYLLDADLNKITWNFATRCRPKWHAEPTRIYLNIFAEADRAYERYPSCQALAEDLLREVKGGSRVYVATNSKRWAKTLHKLLGRTFGDAKRILLITADEKSGDQAASFLKNPANEFLGLDVVIATPAMGTGIDITFPGNASEVDVSYGFFLTDITSHYDCDQQLARVRSPQRVKVWIDPRKASFEIDPSVVASDLVQTLEAAAAIHSYSRSGSAEVDGSHPLLLLQTDVYCAHRASQNDLLGAFQEHKRRYGWTPITISKSRASDSVKADLKAAREEVERDYAEGIVSARAIDRCEYEDLLARRSVEAFIGGSGGLEIERFELETFYGETISPELVQRDRHGRFREELRRYQALRLDGNADSGFRNWVRCLSESTSFSSEQRSLMLALSSGGLLDEEGLNAEKEFSKSDLQGFQNFCANRRSMIQRDLGIVVRDDLARDPVKSLNLFLNRIGLRATKIETRKRRGEKIRTYRLDPARLLTTRTTLQKVVENERKREEEDRDASLDGAAPRRRSKRFEHLKFEDSPRAADLAPFWEAAESAEGE